MSGEPQPGPITRSRISSTLISTRPTAFWCFETSPAPGHTARRWSWMGSGSTGSRGGPAIRTRKARTSPRDRSRKTVQGNRASGFWLTNLTLSTPRLWERVALSASVYNLFDKVYGDPGSTEHLQDVIEQDGRTFRVKVTASF